MSEPSTDLYHVEPTEDHDFDAATVERVPFALIARMDELLVVTALIDTEDRARSLALLLNKLENGEAVIVDLSQIDFSAIGGGSEGPGEDEVADELAKAAE